MKRLCKCKKGILRGILATMLLLAMVLSLSIPNILDNIKAELMERMQILCLLTFLFAAIVLAIIALMKIEHLREQDCKATEECRRHEVQEIHNWDE